MSANDKQVGGDHYRKTEGEQHWDRAARLKLNYFQAAATKYIERALEKGSSVEDLEKGAHFCTKLAELIKAGIIKPNNPRDPYYHARVIDATPPKTGVAAALTQSPDEPEGIVRSRHFNKEI